MKSKIKKNPNIEYFLVFRDSVKYKFITKRALTCFTASFPMLPVWLAFLPSLPRTLLQIPALPLPFPYSHTVSEGGCSPCTQVTQAVSESPVTRQDSLQSSSYSLDHPQSPFSLRKEGKE